MKQQDTAAEQMAAEEAESRGSSETIKPQAAAKAEAADEQKQELAESLPKLKEEQTHLAERLNVVVDALENEGWRS